VKTNNQLRDEFKARSVDVEEAVNSDYFHIGDALRTVTDSGSDTALRQTEYPSLN
jgi:hypothetical protein